MTNRALSFLLVLFGASVATAQGTPSGEQAVSTNPAQPPPTAATPASDLGTTWTDATTKLVWQRDAADRDMVWKDAGEYCETNTAGLPGSGWRLPTIDELKALLTKENFRGCGGPPGLTGECGIYWSATEAGSKSESHYVDFARGIADFDDKGFAYRARCVRKGP